MNQRLRFISDFQIDFRFVHTLMQICNHTSSRLQIPNEVTITWIKKECILERERERGGEKKRVLSGNPLCDDIFSLKKIEIENFSFLILADFNWCMAQL